MLRLSTKTISPLNHESSCSASSSTVMFSLYILFDISSEIFLPSGNEPVGCISVFIICFILFFDFSNLFTRINKLMNCPHRVYQFLSPEVFKVHPAFPYSIVHHLTGAGLV